MGTPSTCGELDEADHGEAVALRPTFLLLEGTTSDKKWDSSLEHTSLTAIILKRSLRKWHYFVLYRRKMTVPVNAA